MKGVSCNWREVIFHEIADKRFKRKDVARTYRLIIEQYPRDAVDWESVNKAIIERWSMSGLLHIKNLAWGDKESLFALEVK